MQALMRTPDQHDLAETRGPRLKPSTHSDLPVAGLQESATSPSREIREKIWEKIKLFEQNSKGTLWNIRLFMYIHG